MSDVYPDNVKIYAKLSAWIDITPDVISNINGNWGIANNTPISRLADTGVMKFKLNNSDGKYTPGNLAGWNKGTEIKLVIVYENDPYIKFYGKVDEITLDSGTNSAKSASVVVTDWLDYATKYPLTSLAVQTNKRADEAIETLLSSMPITPQNTRLDQGENTFSTIFDNTPYKTKAYTELNKIALSELGYIYLTKDRDHGETLIFELAKNRTGITPLSKIPLGFTEFRKIFS